MPEFPQLKDIVMRPEPVDYVPWIVGGVILLPGLAALAYWLVKWLRRKAGMVSAPSLVEAREAALGELRRLESQARGLSGAQTVAEVQRVLRTYLHRHHGALGLYRTADELIGRRREDSPPPNPLLAHIEDILRRCEELRYGDKDLPGDTDRLALIGQAIKSIKSGSSAAPPPLQTHA